MRLERVVIASHNPDKIAELEVVLGRADVVGEIVRGLTWPDIVEDAPTLECNALLKARAVADITGLPAIGDDTGLEVDALGGAPGVYTARFSGPGATYETNVAALLAALEGIADRGARFRTAIALVSPSGDELVSHGELVGIIATKPRGEGGFGYDPIFEVDGRTLAEIGIEEKNVISHRARAMSAMAEMLRLA